MLKPKDREIVRLYTASRANTEPLIAEKMGLSRYQIRAAIERARAYGLNVDRPPLPPAPEEAPARVFAGQPSMPKLRSIAVFDAKETRENEERSLRLEIKPRQMTPAEELRAKRLSQIKQIHQDGLRRGLFRVGSR